MALALEDAGVAPDAVGYVNAHGSSTPLNDSTETLKRLYHGLLAVRVRPYYLYQCDPISGSSW